LPLTPIPFEHSEYPLRYDRNSLPTNVVNPVRYNRNSFPLESPYIGSPIDPVQVPFMDHKLPERQKHYHCCGCRTPKYGPVSIRNKKTLKHVGDFYLETSILRDGIAYKSMTDTREIITYPEDVSHNFEWAYMYQYLIDQDARE